MNIIGWITWDEIILNQNLAIITIRGLEKCHFYYAIYRNKKKKKQGMFVFIN